jgi:hypothetical protein
MYTKQEREKEREILSVGDEVRFWDGTVAMRGVIEEIKDNNPMTKALVKGWPAASPSTVRRFRIERYQLKSVPREFPKEESKKSPYKVVANLEINVAGTTFPLLLSGEVLASSAKEAETIFIKDTDVEVNTKAKDNRPYRYFHKLENAIEKCVSFSIRTRPITTK